MFFQCMCAEEEEEAVSYRKCACKRKRHKISEDLVFILIFFLLFLYLLFFFSFFFHVIFLLSTQWETTWEHKMSIAVFLFPFILFSYSICTTIFNIFFLFLYLLHYAYNTYIYIPSLLFGCTLKCQESILPNTNNHKYKLSAAVIHQKWKGMMFNSIKGSIHTYIYGTYLHIYIYIYTK